MESMESNTGQCAPQPFGWARAGGKLLPEIVGVTLCRFYGLAGLILQASSPGRVEADLSAQYKVGYKSRLGDVGC